jgi:translation initiation factor IF-2
VETPQPEPVPEIIPPVEEPAPVVPEPEVTKVETPEIDGPKVITKIDLSSIDSSTRPKKVIKKKEEEPQPEPPQEVQPEPEVVEKQEQPVAEKTEEPVVTPTPVPEVEEEKQVVIENIKADKLEGPKIIGKIQLPVENDTRPKPRDEKRKRKRIPLDKKDGGGQQQKQGQGGQHQQGGQQRSGNQQGGQHKGGNQQGGQHKGGQQQQGGGNRRDRRRTTREDKEINQKEIQDKIRETQARLAGASGRGKSLKAKYRRAKREEMADQMDGTEMDDNKLQVTEFISVSELANLMDVSFADVISKCMSLGIMVSINQRLDAEVIELVAGEFGFDVEFIGMEEQAEMEEEEIEDDGENQQPRPPIVTIMGHVDHGKTSLLDYIRSANVVAGEAGGITQHIGAYEVTLRNGKQITFLDTPGHEAFTAMRARGAKVTDIAVIVVAADDAVMPQTREAISHAQAAGVPMIFAVNKIDKDGANPQKIYEQLSQLNLLVEEWGGKYQSQELSAKQGLNVDMLLEKILLEAELLELKANPDTEAGGTIVEASLDKGRGYVATVLVQNGTLRQGDIIVSGQHFGRIKAMFNERNQRVTEAPPSTPVLILGLNGAPQAGEKFKVYEDESEAKETANRRAQILREQGIRAKKHITMQEIGRRIALGNFKELNIIIKGDFDGSVEALSDSLQKLTTEEIAVRVVHKAVGQISESDVLLATASDAIIIGFNVRPSIQAARLAEKENIEIKTYSIIYNAIEEIKSAMEGMLEPKIQEKVVANVEIRETYKFDKVTVAGCFVIDGKINRNNKIRIVRDGIVVFTGELASLKRFKDDVKEVSTNMECGLSIRNYSDIKVGDIVEAFEEEEVKRTL